MRVFEEKGKKLKQERGFSAPVDLIRTVAIVGVILLHSANDLTIQHINMSMLEAFRWTTVDVYQSLGRMGVPLFLLLTGALLLQPAKLNEPMGTFFKKRLARIGLPFLFWGAAYFAWDFFVDHQINSQPITSGSIIQGILTGPYYQFWYLYLLLGLYLVTPILRVVIAHAERNLIKYFLILWLLGVAIVPVFSLVTPYHLDSNVLAITGYAGYFILGAYFLTVRMRRSNVLILLSLGIALTAIGTYAIAATVGGTEMYFFQQYLSPTMILASVMLFLFLANIQTSSAQPMADQKDKTDPEPPRNSHKKLTKLLGLISGSTLGIYLFHEMLLEALQKGYFGFAINGNTINSIVGVPLMTVIVLFASLGVILALKKVPVLKKLVG